MARKVPSMCAIRRNTFVCHLRGIHAQTRYTTGRRSRYRLTQQGRLLRRCGTKPPTRLNFRPFTLSHHCETFDTLFPCAARPMATCRGRKPVPGSAGRLRPALGFIFLAGPRDHDPSQPSTLTNQPPVCRKHTRATARLCPHLEDDPTVFLARSAPLYGVHGTLYGRDAGGVKVVAQPDAPLPYGHPNLGTFLASQLVRRLQSFRVIGLDELLNSLATAS